MNMLTNNFHTAITKVNKKMSHLMIKLIIHQVFVSDITEFSNKELVDLH